jgi:hypothetical protein
MENLNRELWAYLFPELSQYVDPGLDDGEGDDLEYLSVVERDHLDYLAGLEAEQED